MKKKTIIISVLFGLVMLGVATTAPVSAKTCGGSGGINVGIINKNWFYGAQISKSVNKTGGSALIGNIGGPIINQSGDATSTTTQTQIANNNSTTLTVTGGSSSNTTNFQNTGNFVSVCTSAN